MEPYPSYGEMSKKIESYDNMSQWYTESNHHTCKGINEAYKRHNLEQVRNLGCVIHEDGGIRSMRLAYTILKLFSPMGHDTIVLQYQWDEIGDWSISKFLLTCTN